MRQGIGCVCAGLSPVAWKRSGDPWPPGGWLAAAPTSRRWRRAPLATIFWSSSCEATARGRSLLPWRRRQAAGGAALALCDPGDARAISLAVSSGFDDLLAMPFDSIELVRRVRSRDLSHLTAERRSRNLMFAAYRECPPAALAPCARRATGPGWWCSAEPTTVRCRWPQPTVGERELPRWDVKPALDPGGRR